MIVKVRLFGSARRLSDRQTPGIWQGDIPSGATIADLIDAIGSTQREITAAAVDGQSVAFSTVVDESLDIVLVTAVGGG
jgi:sulfur carrier protein ThiS